MFRFDLGLFLRSTWLLERCPAQYFGLIVRFAFVTTAPTVVEIVFNRKETLESRHSNDLYVIRNII